MNEESLPPGRWRSLFGYGRMSYLVGCACGCGATIEVPCALLSTLPAPKRKFGQTQSQVDEMLLEMIDVWKNHGPERACISWSWRSER